MMTPELCRGLEIRLVAIRKSLNLKTDTSGWGGLSGFFDLGLKPKMGFGGVLFSLDT